MPPLFWRRTLQGLRTRLSGEQVSLDTNLNEIGERSLLTCASCQSVKTVGATAATTEILPAVPNLYYIIRGIVLANRQAAGDATTLTYIQIKHHETGVSTTIYAMQSLGTTVGVYNGSICGLSIPTKENQVVSLIQDAQSTSCWVTVYYDPVVVLR